jgi:hypothetical protein
MSNSWFLDQARQGNVYHSHNTTAGAVTVLSATCTGLVIENPYGSGKDLVMESMSFTGSTLTTIREMGIAVNATIDQTGSTTTTAAVIHNGRNIGSDQNVGIGLSFSIATLPAAPVWLRPIGNARVTGAVEGLKSLIAQFDGSLIVPPGGFVCFSTLTAAATGLCSATWAEVKILNG